jgi:predicted DNA-binding transcriptional regulator YafY
MSQNANKPKSKRFSRLRNAVKKNEHFNTRPPVERMGQIHAGLQSGRFPNAWQLSEELEVSERTILRDLDFMRERMGLPIAYDALHRGFHYTEEVGAFPPIQVTEGELFALLVAEKALQQYRGTTFEKPLLSAFTKMVQSLPETISFNLNEWDQSISFRMSAEPIVKLEIFDTLSRATAQHEQLLIRYRKPGKRIPELRLIDPYHLANINGEWFLFAHDHLRKDIRTFVPARVTSIENTGRKFERPASFSLEKHLRDSFGVHAGKADYNIVIRFNESAADYIREKKWHKSQKIRDLPNGGLELTMTLSSIVEVERWVLSWGGNAQVIKPTELVKRVQTAAKQMAKLHC